jgi:lysophospholipase L1-like esterase
MKSVRIFISGVILLLLASSSDAQPLFEKGARVLFQGDSITDMARGRTEDPNHILGHSYVFLIAAKEGADFPERRITFINRGVSGNTVSNLMARWRTNTLELKPDVLSILIGVNDVGHQLRAGRPFLPEKFEETYDQLLADTLAALPRVKLVLGEPFFAPGKSTEAHLDEWREAMMGLRAVVEKLGKKYHAPVVHYQKVFDDAAQRAPIDYWIWDGVHPTYRGHQLMADEWKRTYRSFYGPPGDAR